MPTNYKKSYDYFGLISSSKTFNLTGTTTTNLIIAPSSPYANYIKSLVCSNSSGINGIDIQVSGSIAFSQYLAGSGGGFVESFNPFWALSSAQSLQASLRQAGDVYLTVNYFVDLQTTR